MAGHDEMIGQIIDGRYEIQGRIGAGAMGEVYEARQIGIDLIRAIKLIRAELLDTAQVESRFKREALALGLLQHPSIVEVLELGRLPEGGLFMVMELVPGPDSQHFVEANGPLLLGDALDLLSKVAEGLAYAHAHGVVHRDLKPGNVILRNGDASQPKIVDFGLAKLMGAEGLTKLTADEQILGTPSYMSPEQCQAIDAGAPSDVYALGGLMCFYLTGAPVFSGGLLTALILAHCYNIPEPLSARISDLDVSANLDALFLRCVAKDPAARPSAAEVGEALVAELRQCRMQEDAKGGVIVAGGAGAVAVSESGMALASRIWAPGRRRPWEVPGAETQGLGKTIENGAMADKSAFMERRAGAGEAGEGKTVAGSKTGADDSGERARIHEALANQIAAVVKELALALPPSAKNVVARRTNLDEIESSLSGLQLDLALLESQMGEEPQRPSTELHGERERLANETARLRGRADEELRALFHEVYRHRHGATDPVAQALYRELDDLCAQLGPIEEDPEGRG